MEVNNKENTGVRTFALRRSRLSTIGARDLQKLMLVYGITFSGIKPDWYNIFGKNAPLHLEIGSGSGESVIHSARKYPKVNQITFELYPRGMVSILRSIEQAGLTNVRVVMADALQCLENFFADQTLSGIRVFFPDPWPKNRHRKRRMVNSSFLSRAYILLKPGSTFEFASDFYDYYKKVLDLAIQSRQWKVIAAGPTNEYRADRPVTRFEQRAIIDGGTVFDIKLRRI